ncbi:hypothetical protein E8E14_012227 [Neopestalotiopsis sp. 37M]|nr:hypothetical protein E8E14_012227 [Neopestalotiopsis sp. 37M]
MDHFWILATAPVLVPVFFALLSSIVIIFILNSPRSSELEKIPLIGEEFGGAEQRRKVFLSTAQDLYNKGYEKFKDRAFRLTGTDGERIVLPRRLLDDVKRMPDSHISIEKAIEKSNEIKYTGLGGKSNETEFLIHLIRSDLTHGLSRVNPRLESEVTCTVAEELGPCNDWTEAIIYQKMLRIVAIASGNIFLGPELCRSENWIVPATMYTVDLFTAIGKLKQWRKWTRPIGQYFIPEIKSLHQHRRKAVAWLSPIVAERRRMMEKGHELPDDMLQWMMNKSADYDMTTNLWR